MLLKSTTEILKFKNINDNVELTWNLHEKKAEVPLSIEQNLFVYATDTSVHTMRTEAICFFFFLLTKLRFTNCIKPNPIGPFAFFSSVICFRCWLKKILVLLLLLLPAAGLSVKYEKYHMNAILVFTCKLFSYTKFVVFYFGIFLLLLRLHSSFFS